MEEIKSIIKEPDHYAIFFYEKNTMEFIGSYSICKNYLYNLHIETRKRSTGYGSELVKHAMREKKELFLDVDPDNKIAKKCYEKCGFKFERKLFNYHHPCWGEKVPPADEIERYFWREIVE